MPPALARIVIGCGFVMMAWFTRRQTRRRFVVVEKVQPHRAKAFRVERGLVDVLCAAMLIVGLAFLIA